jgi:hypothetical protein
VDTSHTPHHGTITWPPSPAAIGALAREGMGVISSLLVCWAVWYGATVALPQAREEADRKTASVLERLGADQARQHDEIRWLLNEIRLELRNHRRGP